MNLAEIREQDRAVEILRRAVARRRLAHSLIFTGPPGVGKRATALRLAATLLCPESSPDACGRCPECKLLRAGTHPDVSIEDLERAQAERATATLVSIDQIRRLRSYLSLRPARATSKVAIVDQAEKLTLDAQNALLKTLEEPPGHATLVLIATNVEALIPTIRSRCQTVSFAPLSSELVAELLSAEGIDATAAAQTAALCEGSLDRARLFAREDGLARGEDLRGKLAGLDRRPLTEVLDLAAELSGPRGERGRVQQAVNAATLLSWYRARLVDAAASARDADSEDPERLEEVRAAVGQLEQVYAASRDIERNANVHLAWDRALLDLRES